MQGRLFVAVVVMIVVCIPKISISLCLGGSAEMKLEPLTLSKGEYTLWVCPPVVGGFLDGGDPYLEAGGFQHVLIPL